MALYFSSKEQLTQCLYCPCIVLFQGDKVEGVVLKLEQYSFFEAVFFPIKVV